MGLVGARILVVEDDPFMREAVDWMLTQAGHECNGVRTGEEALALVRRWMPEIILLDIGLPTISGLQVLHQLRARGISVPILMMTANASSGVVQDVMQMGGTGYVLKPFEASDLLNRVAAALAPSVPKRTLWVD